MDGGGRSHPWGTRAGPWHSRKKGGRGAHATSAAALGLLVAVCKRLASGRPHAFSLPRIEVARLSFAGEPNP